MQENESVLPAQEQVPDTVTTETGTDTELPETGDPQEGSEQGEQSQEDSGDDPKPRKKHWAHERIGELTAKQRQTERENAALKAELDAVRKSPQSTKPTLEQFDHDLAAYTEALTDWKMEERERQTKISQSRQQAESQQDDVQVRSSVLIEEGRSKYPDFDRVVMNDAVAITPDMAVILAESDRGSDLAYHLGKNPSIAAQIAKLSPLGQARELGKLEVTLSNPAPRTTKAPPPVKPVNNGSGGSTKDFKDMSQEEYEAWLRKKP